MPVIRHLCVASETPAASPHVFAGVASVLAASSADDERGPASNGRLQLLTLVATVYLCVSLRMRGREVGGAEFGRATEQTLRCLRTSAAVRREVEEIGPEELHACLADLQGRGVFELDWYVNVPLGADDADGEWPNSPNAGADDEDDDEDEEIRRPVRRRLLAHYAANTLHPGLGTMVF
jgi:origin recognition complex subunit 6